jgi:hypothetical protein
LRLSFSRWVFKPPEERLPAEDERWWDECYLPDPIEDILENRSQWCALTGGYQDGKSTLLASLTRRLQGRALVIRDDARFLPEKEKSDNNILYHILSRASWTLRQDLVRAPDKFSRLSPTQMEFLRWSVEKFHGRRAFMRWLDGLPQEISQTLHAINFEDLYPSQAGDVAGQIEELVNLGAKLDYEQVLTIVDSPPLPSQNQIEGIERILGWLEPMQDYRLKTVIALPPSMEIQRIRELTRGRVSILQLESTPDRVSDIVSRHLSVATEGGVHKIEQICSSRLIAQFKEFIRDEFGTAATGAWLKIIDIALKKITETDKATLGVDVLSEIKREFYERWMPIRLGSESAKLGCWRGYTWIPLERAVYDFLAALKYHQNRHVDHEVARTSKGNLHTLAKRLRTAIEPDKEDCIYVKNVKGEGYSLEHFAP